MINVVAVPRLTTRLLQAMGMSRRKAWFDNTLRIGFALGVVNSIGVPLVCVALLDPRCWRYALRAVPATEVVVDEPVCHEYSAGGDCLRSSNVGFSTTVTYPVRVRAC